MRLNQSIFLSRSDFPVKGAGNLMNELQQTARGAERIVILSAYFGVEFIRQFFQAFTREERKICQLTLVLGLETPAGMVEAVRQLSNLEEELKRRKFLSVEIRLVNTRQPFHVKLYHITKNGRNYWLSGSANFSPAIEGARHELMLKGRGSHEQLEAYEAALIEGSTPVRRVKPKVGVVYDLRSFLLAGSLCYRPTQRLNLTFEACKIEDAHRRVLKQRLAENSAVPHADPRTEGFGFSLFNAAREVTRDLTLHSPDLDDETPEARTDRLRIPHQVVETIHGYWIPEPYAKALEERVGAEARRRIENMRRLSMTLAQIEPQRLLTELDSHVEGLRTFFQSHDIEIVPKANYREKFEAFVHARVNWLQNPARIERLARRLVVERVPDLWADWEAAQRFEATFFDDLALRFDSEAPSWITAVLGPELDGADLTDPDELRQALEERLARGFRLSLWEGVEADDEPEAA